MNSFVLPAWTLTQREVVRFLRQKNRVFSALGQPIFFWMLLGSGLDASFKNAAYGELGYREYFFPGTLVMSLLFTAIFATFSIIEDRNEGFLQGVLVSPAPRLSIATGKILGGSLIALFHAALFLVLAPVAGIPLTVMSYLSAMAVMLLIGVALTGLGFAIAWNMKSTQGFHAVMMVFLMPLWFLSGSIFPAENAPGWLRLIITCNPLSYGVAAIRRILYSTLPDKAGTLSDLPDLTMSLGITVGFALAMILLSAWVANRRSEGMKITTSATK